MKSMLDFIKLELLNAEGLLENIIKTIPINKRKPIHKRIKRLREAINMIDLCVLSSLTKENPEK